MTQFNFRIAPTFPPLSELTPFSQRPEAYMEDGKLSPIVLQNMWRLQILATFEIMGYNCNYNRQILETEGFTPLDNVNVMDELLNLAEHVNFVKNQRDQIDLNLTKLVNKINDILSDLLIGFRLPYYRGTNTDPNFETIFLSNLNLAFKMLKYHMNYTVDIKVAYGLKNIINEFTYNITGILRVLGQPVLTPDGEDIVKEDRDTFFLIVNTFINVLMQASSQQNGQIKFEQLFANLVDTNKKQEAKILELEDKNCKIEMRIAQMQQELFRKEGLIEGNNVQDIISSQHRAALEKLAETTAELEIYKKDNDVIRQKYEALLQEQKIAAERIQNQDAILNELRETERAYNALVTTSEQQQAVNQQLKNEINKLNTQKEGGLATIDNLKAEIENLKANLNKQEDERQTLAQEQIKLNTQIAEQSGKIEELHSKISLLNAEIAEMQEQNNKYFLENKQLNRIISALNNQIAELNQQIADQEVLKAKVQKLNHEIQAHIENENNINSSLEEQMAERNRLEQILRQLNDNYVNNNQLIGNLNQQTNSRQNEINRLLQQVNEYEETIAELKQKLVDQDKKINQLKDSQGQVNAENQGLQKQLAIIKEKYEDVQQLNDVYASDKFTDEKKIRELEEKINSLLKEQLHLKKTIDTNISDQKLLSDQQKELKEKLRNETINLEEQNEILEQELKKYEIIDQGYQFKNLQTFNADYGNWFYKQGQFVKDLVDDLDSWWRSVAGAFNKIIPNEVNVEDRKTLVAFKYMWLINNEYVNAHRKSVAVLKQKLQKCINELKITNGRYQQNKKQVSDLVKEVENLKRGKYT